MTSTEATPIQIPDKIRELLASVIDEAYAYRIGDCSGPHDEELWDADRENLWKVRQLAEAFGINEYSHIPEYTGPADDEESPK